jgi:hypothetical protein
VGEKIPHIIIIPFYLNRIGLEMEGINGKRLKNPTRELQVFTYHPSPITHHPSLL